MTLADILILSRRRAWILLLATLAGAVIGLAAAHAAPVTYTATATAYVRAVVSADEQGHASAQYAAEQLAISQAESLAPVMTSQAVAQAVVEALGLDTSPAALAGALTATHTADTHTLVVTAQADSPALARAVADEAVTQTASELEALEGAESPARVLLLSSAQLAEVTRSPAPARVVAAGAAGALVLAYAGVLLTALRGTRPRASEPAAPAAGARRP